MSVKLCGRMLRWHKPIKIKTFLRLSLSLVLAVSFAPNAFAAEKKIPCLSIEKHAAPQKVKSSPAAVTRKQAPANLPGMALALALGLRDIHGPVQKTYTRTLKNASPSLSQRHALLLPRDKGCSSASLDAAQPRMAMER